MHNNLVLFWMVITLNVRPTIKCVVVHFKKHELIYDYLFIYLPFYLFTYDYLFIYESHSA